MGSGIYNVCIETKFSTKALYLAVIQRRERFLRALSAVATNNVCGLFCVLYRTYEIRYPRTYDLEQVRE